MAKMLDDRMLGLVDAYWRASNYLTVGQIYLRDNPLLREPLRAEHIKPRLLGHWGTSPGQNFIYVHLNRLICEYDADVIYISGPGHGGPSLTSHTWLEGSYTEVNPKVPQDIRGMTPAVQTIFIARRRAESRRSACSGIDSRRWRARLFAGACVRCGVR